MKPNSDLEYWILSVLNAQVIMSFAVVIALFGWSLWRVLIIVGWIQVKKKVKSLPREKTATKGVANQQKKKLSTSISRQALYSSRHI